MGAGPAFERLVVGTEIVTDVAEVENNIPLVILSGEHGVAEEEEEEERCKGTDDLHDDYNSQLGVSRRRKREWQNEPNDPTLGACSIFIDIYKYSLVLTSQTLLRAVWRVFGPPQGEAWLLLHSVDRRHAPWRLPQAHAADTRYLIPAPHAGLCLLPCH